MIRTFILCATLAALILGAFYIGISRELCRRDYTAKDYEVMKLDCNSWLYR